ncbi:MAG: alpha/beta fold hydrolase [Chitinispirillaceae bacterium]|nr:alpha/beta fold hydrolase [Chitinispirillaceae bacterium]
MKSRCRPVQWENSRQTVRGTLHVTRPRGGTWCVLCHGFTGHRIGPGYLFVRLSREMETVGVSSLRFDFRGSGESDGQFKDMTVDAMLSDLSSAVRLVRERFVPDHLLILGHSLGGMIAALYCSKNNADGIALLSPVADPSGLIRRRNDLINAGPNAAGFYENGPHEISRPFIDSLKNIDPPALLAGSFRGRLLLIQGDADASISVAESARYVEATGAADIETGYYILKNADHNFSTVSHMREAVSRVTTWVKGFEG